MPGLIVLFLSLGVLDPVSSPGQISEGQNAQYNSKPIVTTAPQPQRQMNNKSRSHLSSHQGMYFSCWMNAVPNMPIYLYIKGVMPNFHESNFLYKFGQLKRKF